jgi:nicotinamidase/pyrazinamidase
MNQAIDSYSGFYDNERKEETGLSSLLHSIQANSEIKLYVCGLATNFCVLFTVIDALKEGHETFLITDACRGIDINPGDVEKSVQQMMDSGARLVSSKGILNRG